jgi:hypothetical protein
VLPSAQLMVVGYSETEMARSVGVKLRLHSLAWRPALGCSIPNGPRSYPAVRPLLR